MQKTHKEVTKVIKVTKQDIFKKDIQHLRKVAAKIENIVNKFEKIQEEELNNTNNVI